MNKLLSALIAAIFTVVSVPAWTADDAKQDKMERKSSTTERVKKKADKVEDKVEKKATSAKKRVKKKARKTEDKIEKKMDRKEGPK